MAIVVNICQAVGYKRGKPCGSIVDVVQHYHGIRPVGKMVGFDREAPTQAMTDLNR